ncbi:hypothetical protein L4X63_20350 [Geomonas sp. Red32]|uniref:hypothetical protein n=1 Tax=Geomonas sp. Red32 TaxID=2912856 RepID=UPI00202CEEC3|nr:hypothetical protein [Geomonas sp. Red32]MCM0083937.1 hypothetical protein [Geomonas sp. Red32]
MIVESLAIGAISATIGFSPIPMSSAQSPVARFVTEKTVSNRKHLQSAKIFGLDQPDQELQAIYSECKDKNWDGYGAFPVLEETYQAARLFLIALPLGSRMPSIGAEPDGHVTFEWYHAPRQVLSISIAPDGMLHYAGLFGSSRAYGSEAFLGSIPARILDLIKTVPSA